MPPRRSHWPSRPGRESGDPRPRRRPVALAGLAIVALGLALAVASPLAELSERSFAYHMIQHELFAFVLPPALLLCAGALGPVDSSWRMFRSALAGVDAVSRPLPALAASTAVLWLWHLPVVYDLALSHEGAHVLEHASLFAAYLLFWRPLVGLSQGQPVLASRAGRAAYLVVGAMQAAILGAAITFADQAWYRSYSGVVDPILPALADQQVGGAIMWFSGPVVFGIAAFLTMGARPTAGTLARVAEGTRR